MIDLLVLTTLADVSFTYEGIETGWLTLLAGVGAALYLLNLKLSDANRLKGRGKRPDARTPQGVMASPRSFAAAVPQLGTIPARGGRPRTDPECKRKFIRRESSPVEILLADPADPKLSHAGTVINRSRGGLLISTERPTLPGEVILVRAINAPDTVEWVRIEIRHCRKKEGKFYLGSAFQDQLSWGILLFFG